MKRVGFIGLGALGKAIARRLIDEGVDLVVWNRTLEKAQDLGVDVVRSPADLWSLTDRVLVIVFDSDASREVIFGENGLVSGDIEGKTVIDMTTNRYRYAEWAYQKLKDRNAFYLDAPVLGSVVPARRGELTMVVGGDREVFEENRDLFAKFCKNIYYLGAAGMASKVKLINNIVLGGIMVLLSEAVAFAEKAGVNKEQIIEILETGAGKSYILDVKKKKLLEEDFSTHFSVDLIYKDLHYAQELLKDLNLFSFVASAVRETYGLARKSGFGSLDFSAVYRLFK